MIVFYVLCSVALFAITNPVLFFGGIALVIFVVFLTLGRQAKGGTHP